MREEFESIVKAESRRLYGLSFRLTGDAQEAEDLCQDAFARAFRKFGSFEGRSQISTWLHRIVINAWKNRLRARRGLRVFGFFRRDSEETGDTGAEHDAVHSNEAPPEAQMEKRESQQLLQSALSRLDPEEREIIVLRDLEDRSYEEIGDLLEVPVGTVKSRLARARNALRATLAPILRARGELS